MATRSTALRPFRVAVIAAIASLGASSAARAAFVEPQAWDRGLGGATYQHWNAFSTTTSAAPDVASVNPSGTASLSETTGGAFATSGGNIYSPGVATRFTVTIPEADVPTPPHDVTAIVQFKTLGTELDPASIRLNGLAPVDSAELSRVALGGFGGAQVESWFLFNVPYANFGDGTAGAELLTLTFDAAGSSMSLDELSVDTALRPFGFYAEANPVPEPAALALIPVAGWAALARRRRRERQSA